MDDNIRVSMGKKASNITLAVNIILMLSKAFAGVVARSAAITADAFNNGTDIFATIAVFGGLRVAYLPPDEKHHYGHANAEPIVSKIVAIIIMFTGVSIGWSSVKQIFSNKTEAPGFLAIAVSLFSMFVKFFLYRYTNKIGHMIDSTSIVADSYNHRSDVLASAAVLVGVAGARLGFPLLDPIAGLIVSVIIFKTGISIYIESINALMDTAPSPEVIDIIKKTALSTEGIIKLNDIKARMHGPKMDMDLKICVDKDITVEQGHTIAANTKENIMRNVKNADHVMIHVNPCSRKDMKDIDSCISCRFKKDREQSPLYD